MPAACSVEQLPALVSAVSSIFNLIRRSHGLAAAVACGLLLCASPAGAARAAEPPPVAPKLSAPQFWLDNPTVRPGACTWLHWNTTESRTVYLGNAEVAAVGQRRMCPYVDEHYVLRLRGDGGWLTNLRLTLTVAGEALATAPGGSAAGTTAEDAPPVGQAGTAAGEDRTIFSYYFYWYDEQSALHMGRNPRDPSSWLTQNPAGPLAPALRSPAWHQRQLEDMTYAGIDVALPVYWNSAEAHNWSRPGLQALASALQAMRARNSSAPAIGMFYDTTNPQPVDLSTEVGRAEFYSGIQFFFNTIPRAHWALTKAGQPLIWMWEPDFVRGASAQFLADLKLRFSADFGVLPYVVLTPNWDAAARSAGAGALRGDAQYYWGGALWPRLTVQVAAIGPGYDDRLLADRANALFVDRGNGDALRAGFAAATRCRTPWAAVETWNEFHEGTGIAETREQGRSYLDLTRQLAQDFKRGYAAPTPYTGASSVQLTFGAHGSAGGLALLDAQGDTFHTAAIVDGEAARSTGYALVPAPFDYDRDGRADAALLQPASKLRYVQRSSDGRTLQTTALGNLTQPIDFDGDGKPDRAEYWPATAEWNIYSGLTRPVVLQLGSAAAENVPVAGDYDGDGRSDAAVFVPENSTWIVRRSSDGRVVQRIFGLAGGSDLPAPADYDGDGRTDFALFRASSAQWFIRSSRSGEGRVEQWGAPGANALPAAADYDGDGSAELALYLPDSREWTVRTADGKTHPLAFGSANSAIAASVALPAAGAPLNQMYFAIDDGFYFDGGAPLRLTVQYYDNGREPLLIEYDTVPCSANRDPADAYRRTLLVTRQDTRSWRSATLLLTNAAFGNHQNYGADFRIVGGSMPVIISSLNMERVHAAQQ